MTTLKQVKECDKKKVIQICDDDPHFLSLCMLCHFKAFIVVVFIFPIPNFTII